LFRWDYKPRPVGRTVAARHRTRADRIAELAVKSGPPSAYGNADNALAGGLLSNAPDVNERSDLGGG
jgi:hypothetical protein